MEQNWYETELRVIFAETDAMQVVYHANYFNWFEVGRTEMMRSKGLPYLEFEKRDIILPVIEARAHFHASAHYDDEIIVRTRLTEARFKVHFDYEVLRKVDRQLLASGYTVHAWVNREMKPILLRKVEPELYAKIQKLTYEQGQE